MVAGDPGVVVVPAAEPVELAEHLAVELARVVDLEAGEALGVRGDEVGEAAQARRAAEPGHLPPLAVERGAGRGDGGVDVLLAAVGDQRPGLPGVGVLRLEGLPDTAPTALPPITIERVSSSLTTRLPWLCPWPCP